MKQGTIRVFALGILAALALAGCSNPITEIPSEQAVDKAVGFGPETITIYISTEDEDGTSRSVAGLNHNRIKLTGVRNFIQYIALETKTGTVASMGETRKKPNETTGAITLNKLKKGTDYGILVLMGHWPYTGISTSDYVYDTTPPAPPSLPTLLQAGYGTVSIPEDASSVSVSIDVSPIWVNTIFTSTAASSALSLSEPIIDKDEAANKREVKPAVLVPVHPWQVEFIVNRYTGKKITVNGQQVDETESGFIDLLEAEKAVAKATAKPAPTILTLDSFSPVLWIKGPGDGTLSSVVSELGALARRPGLGALDSHMFTYTIPSIFTDGIGKIGTVGYVNLNVPYTPFGLTKTDDWKKDSKNLSKYFGFNDNVPKWVIRNGVNNEAQNARTNYGSTEMPSGSNDTGVNWNGAVGFTVAAVQSKPSGGGPNWEDPNFPNKEFPNYTPFTLTLSPGGWSSKPVTGSAVVLFDTGGDYDGLANWYYVVKESTDPDPLLSEFTTKGTHKAVKGQDANGNDIETPVVVSGIAKDTEFRAWIEIPNYSSSKEYAVWVILEKDWTTSQPICIEEKLLAWETTVDF